MASTESEKREINLHETMDARIWTKEFMKLVKNADQIDEGTLLGWFSNAIMTGFDHANRRNLES